MKSEVQILSPRPTSIPRPRGFPGKEIRMTKSTVAVANKPVWVELSTPDSAASIDFYTRLFGWQAEVHPDPQYGGYAMARIGDEDAAGIGPKQSPEAPTTWSIY